MRIVEGMAEEDDGKGKRRKEEGRGKKMGEEWKLTITS